MHRRVLNAVIIISATGTGTFAVLRLDSSCLVSCVRRRRLIKPPPPPSGPWESPRRPRVVNLDRLQRGGGSRLIEPTLAIAAEVRLADAAVSSR